jgi:hypothetical protein
MPQRKYPRIEIEQKAFDVLQIEAILQHKKIRDIATEAVLSHVSAKSKDFIAHKATGPLDLKTESDKDNATDGPLDQQIADSVCGESDDSEKPKLTEEAKAILSFILEELKADKEPLLPDVAAKFGMPAQTLSKTLPDSIRAKETKRGGKPGRYFTQAMRPQIEEVLR